LWKSVFPIHTQIAFSLNIRSFMDIYSILASTRHATFVL
jgi:hypothetical protein